MEEKTSCTGSDLRPTANHLGSFTLRCFTGSSLANERQLLFSNLNHTSHTHSETFILNTQSLSVPHNAPQTNPQTPDTAFKCPVFFFHFKLSSMAYK